jgi:beta-lactamase class D
MKGLWSGTLAVSSRAMQIARDLTWLEISPNGFKLSGKTGSNSYSDMKRRLGWFMAHIENGDKEYLAVTNLSDLVSPVTGSSGGVQAKEITKKILSDKGLW